MMAFSTFRSALAAGGLALALASGVGCSAKTEPQPQEESQLPSIEHTLNDMRYAVISQEPTGVENTGVEKRDVWDFLLEKETPDSGELSRFSIHESVASHSWVRKLVSSPDRDSSFYGQDVAFVKDPSCILSEGSSFFEGSTGELKVFYRSDEEYRLSFLCRRGFYDIDSEKHLNTKTAFKELYSWVESLTRRIGDADDGFFNPKTKFYLDTSSLVKPLPGTQTVQQEIRFDIFSTSDLMSDIKRGLEVVAEYQHPTENLIVSWASARQEFSALPSNVLPAIPSQAVTEHPTVGTYRSEQ